ncbi:MAG TPA: hypothetical protein VGJ26_06240 [Pirellulales bacterium]|jgi:uncharacterized repeat protein (TIGR01451 family)
MRIWPTLTVLSAVALTGLVMCCGARLDDVQHSIQQWLATSNMATACESCNPGAKLPLLEPLDLQTECPALFATAAEEAAGPELTTPNVCPVIAEESLDTACQWAANPTMGQPDKASEAPLLRAPIVNQVEQAVATSPFAIDSTVASDEAPAKERILQHYVTPVAHKSPTVVAAQPPVALAAQTSEPTESIANATDGLVEAPSEHDGSLARPTPPPAPAVLQPVHEATPRAAEAPLLTPPPTRAASPSAKSDQTSSPLAPHIKNMKNPPPRSAVPSKIHSSETSSASLSGKQSGVTLEWTLPEAVTLGQASNCQLQLRNGTETAAQNVTVTVRLSTGVRVEHVDPRPTAAQGSTLIWELAELAAGAGSAIQLSVVPEAQGEFAPTASVTCTRSVAAKAPIVEPRLAMTIEGPSEAVVGQPTPVHVRVANEGTGSAMGIAVELRLAEGLEGASGFKSKYAIGTLAPGEFRQVQVMISGRDAGSFAISGQTVLGDARAGAATYNVRMIRPSLAVAVEGPKLRFVDRKAEYTINVKNPGPGPIENVQLQETVPAGFRFVEASSGGSFDRQARQVAWFVGHLEPNESANVAVQLVAIEPGEHRLNAEAKADFGVSGEAEATTTVRGAPRVVIDVTEDDDPVEVDGETVYRVRLSNTGSMPANKVQFAGEAPREMQILKVDGPAPGLIKRQQIVFPAVETLGPGETVSYEIHVKCLKAGQVQFRAYFRTQDNPTPVLEEETTRIYAE